MAGFGKLVPTVSAVLRRDEQSRDAHDFFLEAWEYLGVLDSEGGWPMFVGR
jgi:hypothetical protein